MQVTRSGELQKPASSSVSLARCTPFSRIEPDRPNEVHQGYLRTASDPACSPAEYLTQKFSTKKFARRFVIGWLMKIRMTDRYVQANMKFSPSPV
jgi:hypothetical protein